MKKIFLFAVLALSTVINNPLSAQENSTSKFNTKNDKATMYIVDGKEIDSFTLGNIKPDDIESMKVFKGNDAVEKYGTRAKNGVVVITTKKSVKSKKTTSFALNSNNVSHKPDPIYFVDGKETNKSNLDKINPNTIESMSVFKGEDAINKYGAKGKNGVVEIITKKENNNIGIHSEGRVPDPICYIDGKEITYSKLKKIDPDTIDRINIVKGENAINKYGDKGKNGVIEIYLKK